MPRLVSSRRADVSHRRWARPRMGARQSDELGQVLVRRAPQDGPPPLPGGLLPPADQLYSRCYSWIVELRHKVKRAIWSHGFLSLLLWFAAFIMVCCLLCLGIADCTICRYRRLDSCESPEVEIEVWDRCDRVSQNGALNTSLPTAGVSTGAYDRRLVWLLVIAGLVARYGGAGAVSVMGWL